MWIINLEKTDYDEALQLQERCHTARRENRIQDVIMLLEHDPVITFGRSADADDLLVPEGHLEAMGIPVRHVNRGGKITCHYPGQLVGYFIMDLESFGMDIHVFVRNIEDTLALVLADFGIEGGRVRHRTGVWVENNKIAAIGIEVRNRVTLHGFSLNLKENREIYSLFVPCGLADAGVTSMENITGCFESGEVRERFIRRWPVVSGRSVSAVLSGREFQARLEN